MSLNPHMMVLYLLTKNTLTLYMDWAIYINFVYCGGFYEVGKWMFLGSSFDIFPIGPHTKSIINTLPGFSSFFFTHIFIFYILYIILYIFDFTKQGAQIRPFSPIFLLLFWFVGLYSVFQLDSSSG